LRWAAYSVPGWLNDYGDKYELGRLEYRAHKAYLHVVFAQAVVQACPDTAMYELTERCICGDLGCCAIRVILRCAEDKASDEYLKTETNSSAEFLDSDVIQNLWHISGGRNNHPYIYYLVFNQADSLDKRWILLDCEALFLIRRPGVHIRKSFYCDSPHIRLPSGIC